MRCREGEGVLRDGDGVGDEVYRHGLEIKMGSDWEGWRGACRNGLES